MDWARVKELMALRDSGNTEDALRGLELLAQSTSDKNEKASLILSELTCYLLLCKVDDAQRALNRVWALAPDNDEVRLNLAQQEAYLLIAQGKLNQGLLRLDQLLKDYPHVSQDSRYRYLWEDIQQRRAFALVDLGRPAESLPILEQATSFVFDEHKDEQLILLYLGTCYHELGQYDLAKEQFLRVIHLDRSNHLETDARYRLAAIHWRQGALAQAKLRLEEVVSAFGTSREPNVPREEVYELLSKTCKFLGQSEDAERYSKMS